jgi:hypothetical protein
MSALPGYFRHQLVPQLLGIIYFDAQISDSAFDLGVAEQKLDGPEIARASVDQGSFRASQRVRPEQSWVQSNAAST